MHSAEVIAMHGSLRYNSESCTKRAFKIKSWRSRSQL